MGSRQHERHLRRHAAERGDLELGHHAQGVGGAPRASRQVLGAPSLQVARQLGGGAQMRQRRAGHGVPAAAPGLADVALGDEAQLAPAEHGTLRRPRRPRREHDGDGTVVVGVEGRRALAAVAHTLEQGLGAAGHRLNEHRGARLVAPGRAQVLCRHQQARVGRPQHGATLGLHELGVDRSSNRPELGRGHVGHEVLGHRGQQQRHHVALPHAQLGQGHRHLVGRRVELFVSESQPFVGHEGRRGTEAARRLGRGLGEHAAEPTRRARDAAGSPAAGQRGSPSRRSATMLRWISDVPPAMVPANERRYCTGQAPS